MASRNPQNSSSRIPVALRNPSPASNNTDLYMKEINDKNIPDQRESHNRKAENGNIKSDHNSSDNKDKTAKGFETFLMTGEMIIRTNPPNSTKPVKEETPPITVKNQKAKEIPKPGQIESIPPNQKSAKDKSRTPHAAVSSPLLPSKIPGLVKNHSPSQKQEPCSLAANLSSSGKMSAATNQPSSITFVHAPVAEMEEFSDLSQSSCSEGESTLENGHSNPGSPQSLPHKPTPLASPEANNADASSLERAVESLGKMQSSQLPDCNNPGFSDNSFSEPPSSGDSGFIHDGHTSDTDGPDKVFASNLGSALAQAEKDGESNETLIANEISNDGFVPLGSRQIHQMNSNTTENLVACNSDDKVHVHSSNTDRTLVRTSKSHENYLQGGTSLALVNIDIDDNLAYSLDTLTYYDSSTSSLDKVNSETAHQTSKSLDNSPEKKGEKLPGSIEREFAPNFINLENIDQRQNISDDSSLNNENREANDSANARAAGTNFTSSVHNTASQSGDTGQEIETFSNIGNPDAPNLSVISDDPDLDSLYHQPSKAVDRPSAERLAKRLFHLEGFKKSDVSRHLSKKNDFSNLVAEEYLKFFDFQDDTLDSSLRQFLINFSLYGETQERERVLTHFSRRFMECNPGSFNSEDACHTLTCAIMLLNSDLHAPNVGRRMTCQEFIENLAELNDGENFSKDVLKAIYQAIKNEPIEWATDGNAPEMDSQLADAGQPSSPSAPIMVGNNPFLDVPDPSKTTEFKKGYVMRKCCMDPERRRTPFGKRGWKMMYAVLRDLILYQFKDEHQLKKGQFVESSFNAIRIHHSLATKATDYTKKQHVFRLQTAEWSEYLFQTGDSKELQEWIDTINMVAATLSAPQLPGAVGSKVKFQRPLLPSSVTRLSLKEQLYSHETKFLDLEQELQFHRAAAPEKGAKGSVIQEYLDKEIYLEFEIKRFKTYIFLLQSKLTAYPELEPSLVETTIGEYEEMESKPATLPLPSAGAYVTAKGPCKAPEDVTGKSVHRSLSDSDNGGDLQDEMSPGQQGQLVVSEVTEDTRM